MTDLCLKWRTSLEALAPKLLITIFRWDECDDTFYCRLTDGDDEFVVYSYWMGLTGYAIRRHLMDPKKRVRVELRRADEPWGGGRVLAELFDCIYRTMQTEPAP